MSQTIQINLLIHFCFKPRVIVWRGICFEEIKIITRTYILPVYMIRDSISSFDLSKFAYNQN